MAPSTFREPAAHVSPIQNSAQSVTVNLKQNTQDLYALGNSQASQLQNVKIKFFDQQNTPQSSTKENIDPNSQNRSLQKGQNPLKNLATNQSSILPLPNRGPIVPRIMPSPSQYEIHKSLYPQTINQTKVIY